MAQYMYTNIYSDSPLIARCNHLIDMSLYKDLLSNNMKGIQKNINTLIISIDQYLRSYW